MKLFKFLIKVMAPSYKKGRKFHNRKPERQRWFNTNHISIVKLLCNGNIASFMPQPAPYIFYFQNCSPFTNTSYLNMLLILRVIISSWGALFLTISSHFPQ